MHFKLGFPTKWKNRFAKNFELFAEYFALICFTKIFAYFFLRNSASFSLPFAKKICEIRKKIFAKFRFFYAKVLFPWKPYSRSSLLFWAFKSNKSNDGEISYCAKLFYLTVNMEEFYF